MILTLGVAFVADDPGCHRSEAKAADAAKAVVRNTEVFNHDLIFIDTSFLRYEH